VTGVVNDGQQSEYRADRHRQAGCGNRGKVIWRIKNGFDHYVPHYTYNEPRELHDPHDCCSRPVCIYFSLVVIISLLFDYGDAGVIHATYSW
jgi:hypothetical protein